jgi:hypothetical protein
MMKKENRGLPLVVLAFFFAGFFRLAAGPVFSQPVDGSRSAAAFSAAKRLAGKWVRADGGYVLDVEDVGDDGGLKVSYYNPRKIRVYESFWKYTDGRLYILVEMRDVNYPGSKYALFHDRERDLLIGVYYQAAMDRSFDVVFERME